MRYKDHYFWLMIFLHNNAQGSRVDNDLKQTNKTIERERERERERENKFKVLTPQSISNLEIFVVIDISVIHSLESATEIIYLLSNGAP